MSRRHHRHAEAPSAETACGFDAGATITMEADMTALPLETMQSASTDIVMAVAQNPGLVLLDRQRFDLFYERMKVETDKLVPDTLSEKGRAEIRRMATRVRDSKAAIDKARLTLTKQWRDQTDMANAAGKEIKARMEGLEEEVRRPLTEWEDAEEARVKECRAVIDGLRDMAAISLDDTADAVRQRGMAAWNTPLPADRFAEMLTEASAVKESTVATLKSALDRLTREEADRAELTRLRAKAAERERIEAERVAAEQEAQRVADEARRAEERRLAAERADAERIVAAEKAAEDRARVAAERAAQEERDRVQRDHDAALAAQQRRADEAEAARKAEAAKAAREEAARQAETDRIAAEQAKREADKAHRTRVKRAAKEAIMTCGASEDAAQKVVLAIIAGEVPAVTLRF